MVAPIKACKQCKSLVDGATCSHCGGTELAENFKGKISVILPEQSEIAQHLKIHKKGVFAVKLG